MEWEAAKFRLTTPKAFTLTLGTLAHFRHFLLLIMKDAAQHSPDTSGFAKPSMLNT